MSQFEDVIVLWEFLFLGKVNISINRNQIEQNTHLFYIYTNACLQNKMRKYIQTIFLHVVKIQNSNNEREITNPFSILKLFENCFICLNIYCNCN